MNSQPRQRVGDFKGIMNKLVANDANDDDVVGVGGSSKVNTMGQIGQYLAWVFDQASALLLSPPGASPTDPPLPCSGSPRVSLGATEKLGSNELGAHCQALGEN